MSNENEYQNYDFCKDVECSELIKPYDKLDSKCNLSECVKTAKEFHKWLNSNGYKIVKREQNESQNTFKTMRTLDVSI